MNMARARLLAALVSLNVSDKSYDDESCCNVYLMQRSNNHF